MMVSHWPCHRGRKEDLGHTRFEMVTVCPGCGEKPLEIKHAGEGKAGQWLGYRYHGEEVMQAESDGGPHPRGNLILE